MFEDLRDFGAFLVVFDPFYTNLVDYLEPTAVEVVCATPPPAVVILIIYIDYFDGFRYETRLFLFRVIACWCLDNSELYCFAFLGGKTATKS